MKQKQKIALVTTSALVQIMDLFSTYVENMPEVRVTTDVFGRLITFCPTNTREGVQNKNGFVKSVIKRICKVVQIKY
ncbi:MAG: hypothetical protein ACE5HO_05225 [bacterium]